MIASKSWRMLRGAGFVDKYPGANMTNRPRTAFSNILEVLDNGSHTEEIKCYFSDSLDGVLTYPIPNKEKLRNEKITRSPPLKAKTR